MKFIPAEKVQNDLRASICWSNCVSEKGCSACDCGLSVRQIIELIDKHSTDTDSYLLDVSKYLTNERK